MLAVVAVGAMATTASSIFIELLGIRKGLDREFYDTYCLAPLSAYNYAYVIPIVTWANRIQVLPFIAPENPPLPMTTINAAIPQHLPSVALRED